jgi:GNAT superfamily N-acetyltransferase
VRDATPDDAAAIARVHVRTWQSAYAHLFAAEALARLSDTVEARADHWRREMDARHARSHMLVAEIEGSVVGFASFGPPLDEQLDASAIGELYAIYVEPEHSGAGVGRALMAELLQRLRDDGFVEAILWVFDDNPRTRVFYELAGWRADGAVKDETFFGTQAPAVRYRIALRD